MKQNADQTRINLLRPLCDNLGQYRGHFIGGQTFDGLSSDVKRVLYSESSKLSEMLEHIKYETAKYLQDLGYVGAYGIDLFLFEREDGGYGISISEINVRRTMGHVAVKLQKLLGAKSPHFWFTLNKDIIEPVALEKISQHDSEIFPVAPVRDGNKFVSFGLKVESYRTGLDKPWNC